MAAAKKQKPESKKKVITPAAKIKKQKAAKATDGEATEGEKTAGAAVAAIGHNTRIPSAKEVAGYFKRLDAVFTSKNEANAKHMSDIKGIYEEAAGKFGVSRKLVRRLYAKKNAEEAFQDEIDELEPKEKDDLDRIMLGAAKAFGDDSPFGVWLKANVSRDEKDFDEVETKPAPVVKTAAQAALESIESDERAIKGEQTAH